MAAPAEQRDEGRPGKGPGFDPQGFAAAGAHRHLDALEESHPDPNRFFRLEAKVGGQTMLCVAALNAEDTAEEPAIGGCHGGPNVVGEHHMIVTIWYRPRHFRAERTQGQENSW